MAKAEEKPGGVREVSASKEERRPARKKLHKMHISKAENGGFLAEHEFATPPGGMGMYEPPEQHTFGKGEGAKLIEHIHKHLRIPREPVGESGGGEEPAGAATKGSPTPPDEASDEDDSGE
jgi:hypothetical protein